MSAHWERNRGGISWIAEFRESSGDRGTTLRIRTENPPREWLRFDCFAASPHGHIDPAGRDERFPLDERGDVTAEVLATLESDLSPLLERADAPGELRTSSKGIFEDAEGRAFRRELERALRHRPAQLDELDRIVLEARRSEKWHTYPRDVLPAWVAEMDFPVAAAIQDELRRFVEQSDFGYPIGLRETGLAEVFAERMSERFGWAPDPARVEILSEVVQGLYVSLEAYSRPGDGVVIQTPIYPPFLGSVRDMARRRVENRLVPRDGRFEIDFDGLEAGIDADTRVFLFCNPHNPTGRVFDRMELERIAEQCLRHDLIIVSDEIHGDLVFQESRRDPIADASSDRARGTANTGAARHIPLASLGPEIAARTVTLSSPSKAFNIPGLRCAVAHFGSETLQRRFNESLPRHARGGIGLMGLYASIAAWRSAQPWLDEVLPYLEANRNFAEQALRDRLPEIRFNRPEATYLAWLDATDLEIEGSPAAYFLREGRVALSDGRAFGEGWDRYLRLNFATSRSILSDVLDRMAKAVGR